MSQLILKLVLRDSRLFQIHMQLFILFLKQKKGTTTHSSSTALVIRNLKCSFQPTAVLNQHNVTEIEAVGQLFCSLTLTVSVDNII